MDSALKAADAADGILSSEEKRILVALLEKLEAGQKAHASLGGSMSDPAKRARGADGVNDCDFPGSVNLNHWDESPKAMKTRIVPSHVVAEIRIPNGVGGFKEWSDTLVTMAKYKGQQKSFADLVIESSTDREVAKYLHFIHAKYGPEVVKGAAMNPKTQAVDLACFLAATDWLKEFEKIENGRHGYVREIKK